MSKITTRARAKHWCLTINNYTQVDEALFNNPPLFKYAVYGREKGENGTPHLQAFVTMWKQTDLSAMKKNISRAHLEIKRGKSTRSSSLLQEGYGLPGIRSYAIRAERGWRRKHTKRNGKQQRTLL